MDTRWALQLQRLKQLAVAGAKQAKLRKGLTLFLAVILFLQLYFVRELIAAELLFGLGFLVFLALVVLFYSIGYVGERTFNWLKDGVRVAAPVARRGYSEFEEISKAGFRAAAPVAWREYLKMREMSKAGLRAIAPAARRGYTRLEEISKAGLRVTAPVVRRGYAKLEEISKKPFRHPRSESAQ